MHELSIATNIVEICEENALQNNALKITSVTLEIGALSGIVLEALETAMISAKKGSIIEQADINYKIIKGMSQCEDCGNIFESKDIFDLCPSCNSFKTKVIQGKELSVSSMDIET